MSDAITILLVEDNPAEAALIREMLTADGYTHFDVVHTDRLSSSLERIATDEIDGILLDLYLTDSQGLETFTRMAAEAPHLPIVILSGMDDHTLAMEAVQNNAQDYLVKERVDADKLTCALRYAIERKQIEEALRHQTAELLARNEELDAYSHSVAHDLQNPLSVMVGFAEHLKENVETLSPGQARDLIQRVISQGRKMDAIR